MSNAFAPIVRARPDPIFGRPVHPGSPPIDYSPILLRIPFGFHLAADTLSSEARRSVASGPSCLFPAFAFVPQRLLHTFLSLRPARHYPRFWIRRSSSERRRDFNPPDSCAAQRTLRADPPLPAALVLSVSWVRHL